MRMSIFSWPVEMIFIGGTVIGVTGSPSTLLIQAAAYIGDITPIESRGKKFVLVFFVFMRYMVSSLTLIFFRFMILEAGVGVGAGIAGITTGYWIDARGFFEPTACSTALYILSFALIFFLPDSLKIRDQRIQRYEASTAKFVNETNGSLANSNGIEESDSKYGSCSKPEPGLENDAPVVTLSPRKYLCGSIRIELKPLQVFTTCIIHKLSCKQLSLLELEFIKEQTYSKVYETECNDLQF